MAVTSPDGAYYPVAPGQGAEVSGLSSRNFVQYLSRRSRDRPRPESESTCSPIVITTYFSFLTLTPRLPHPPNCPRSTTARTGS